MSLLLGLALLVVDPSVMSHRDVSVLPFLCSAAEKDDDGIPVFAKVHAIPRSEIDAVLEHTSPDAFTFERFPSSNRRSAVVTFAAAAASRL
jgi:hypothetical protein